MTGRPPFIGEGDVDRNNGHPRRRSPFRRGGDDVSLLLTEHHDLHTGRRPAPAAPGTIATVCSRVSSIRMRNCRRRLWSRSAWWSHPGPFGMPAIRSAQSVLASSLVPSHAPASRDLASCTPFLGLQRSWVCPHVDCEVQLYLHGRCGQICRDYQRCSQDENIMLQALMMLPFKCVHLKSMCQ